jgi:hypothetical protein
MSSQMQRMLKKVRNSKIAGLICLALMLLILQQELQSGKHTRRKAEVATENLSVLSSSANGENASLNKRG